MITALILADHDIEALGVTLAALVPGVARGTLRDAVVIDRSAGEDVRYVAEAAGASHVAGVGTVEPWRRGAAPARAPWLFLLAAGDVPDPGWMEAAERFLLVAGPLGGREPRAALLRREERDLRALFARLTRRRPMPQPGMILPRPVIMRGGALQGVRIERLPVIVRRIADSASL
jgi:hypothetical protein